MPDVSRHGRAAFAREGDRIAVLGTTRGNLGGSEYLCALHDKTAGRPSQLDAAAERGLQVLVRELVRNGTVTSAHDASEGGLAVALAECCIIEADRELGARVRLDFGGIPPHAFLFGEDPSRVVISFPTASESAVRQACERGKVPFAVVGTVGGPALVIEGALDLPVRSLAKAWRSGIPAVLKKAS
jgi:phosphoribosylformylglycinamidine (FGAM) synthase-like enzyme